MATKRTRQRHPLTGEVQWSATRGTWSRGQPGAERVVGALRTVKGEMAADMEYGFDPSAVDNARPNAAALARSEALRTLQPLVDAGLVRKPVITAEVVNTEAGEPVMKLRVEAMGADGEEIDTTVTYP